MRPVAEVMPLVYNALDGENPAVLEKALRVVPGLSETLDYTVRPVFAGFATAC